MIRAGWSASPTASDDRLLRRGVELCKAGPRAAHSLCGVPASDRLARVTMCPETGGSDATQPTLRGKGPMNKITRTSSIGLCLIAAFAFCAIAAIPASATVQYGICVAQSGGKFSNAGCTKLGPPHHFEWHASYSCYKDPPIGKYHNLHCNTTNGTHKWVRAPTPSYESTGGPAILNTPGH